jgi:aerobic-type carbon monoxide dehydrogenase small subunit (CoxS/CutS family)
MLVLNINGREHRVDAPADEPLLWVLRDRLQLTGTKYGCGEGQCGACTVLLDGKAARSCRTRVSLVAGKKISTIEGLEQNGKLHAVQEAFIAEDAMQCAYCTPGMIMATVGLLNTNPSPVPDAIVEGLNGNICRCGTYPRIVAAVQRAARAMRDGSRA